MATAPGRTPTIGELELGSIAMETEAVKVVFPLWKVAVAIIAPGADALNEFPLNVAISFSEEDH